MHALQLMKRRDHKSPFVNLPSPQEIAAFDPKSGRECCMANRFSYDIDSRPSTPWNRSAARVFTADFTEHYPQFGKSEAEVLKAWRKHTETLRRQYTTTEQEDAEAAYERSRHRQKERKRQVRIQPLLCTTSHPRFRTALPEASRDHSQSSNVRRHGAPRCTRSSWHE